MKIIMSLLATIFPFPTGSQQGRSYSYWAKANTLEKSREQPVRRYNTEAYVVIVLKDSQQGLVLYFLVLMWYANTILCPRTHKLDFSFKLDRRLYICILPS